MAEDGGPDVLISIRVFDSADEALTSNEIAASWMRDNVLEFTKGMPEVMFYSWDEDRDAVTAPPAPDLG